MVLTKRTMHCRILKQLLDKLKITSTIMVGTAREYDHTARVLLSTYSKLGVGFDDSRLNAAIFAMPCLEIEQYAGRLRDAPGKERIMFDLVDDDSNCTIQWYERRKWMLSRKGVIKNYFSQPDPAPVPAPQTAPPAEKQVRLARKNLLPG